MEDYDSLSKILAEAYEQAAGGKGKARHGTGKPFDEQPMQMISELLGSNTGCAFQAVKKIQEASRLDRKAARKELLGAIVYTAGAIIYLDKRQ